ncbi:hypothetical protein VTK73DRAFT_5815 [Phialemonium thermophilum]|uniref:Ubiquitin-like protein ATG12 n=1 Tax=Phialemonium thermophilum TaxID=223376 RepID=A0ABR3WLK2_9PEZI
MSTGSPDPDPSRAPAAGASPSGASSPASPIPEDASSPDLPLTLTASTVLMGLPRDASAALAAAGGFPKDKVVVRFKPVGAAPALKRDVAKVSSSQKFETVVTHLRRSLRVQDTDSVFLYVNNTFAPALDEIVGNLWRCFKDAKDQLNVSYSLTPAFG